MEDDVIRVFLVDDQELVRAGFTMLVDSQADMRVVGQAGDGGEAIEKIQVTACDVVLMDVRMPVLDGLAATRQILAGATPGEPPRVIMLTTFDLDEYVYDALRAGASGFLLKRTPPDDIIAAIRTVAKSESLLFPEAIRTLALTHAGAPAADGLDRYQLTEREQEVLRLMARGLSNAEIATELFLGLQTVKTHVANVLAKLNARDRTQAVIRAYESGFVPLH